MKVNKPMFDYQLHGLASGDRKNVSGGRMSDGGGFYVWAEVCMMSTILI